MSVIAAASWPGWACIALGAFVLLFAGRADRRGRYDSGDHSWISNIVAELPLPIIRAFYGLIGIVLIVFGIAILAS